MLCHVRKHLDEMQCFQKHLTMSVFPVSFTGPSFEYTVMLGEPYLKFPHSECPWFQRVKAVTKMVFLKSVDAAGKRSYMQHLSFTK